MKPAMTMIISTIAPFGVRNSSTRSEDREAGVGPSHGEGPRVEAVAAPRPPRGVEEDDDHEETRMERRSVPPAAQASEREKRAAAGRRVVHV